MKQSVLDVKIEQVNLVKEKFENAQSSVVVEYRGLTVAQVSELRNLLRAEGVEFKVYKNSIVSRAAEAAGFGELNSQLTGPNAIAFSEDAVAPSRVLAKFAKSHEKLVLKGAVVEGKVVGVDTIQELSKLPSREGMLSMLLSCLQSPVRGFACAVKAVADEKGNNAETPAEAAVETTEVAAEAAAE
ncbi:MAG: 50S ribosomal protein L10 [Erysipelotrichaceae bacterium]